MRSIVIFRFFSHLSLLFVYQCITFLPLIFRFSFYIYDRAGGGGSCLESIGREHCRSCGGPENRRTFVLYYDLFERDDYRDFD